MHLKNSYLETSGCIKVKTMVIKINGYKWKVEMVDGEIEKMHPDPDHYNLGLTEYCEGVISIRKSMSEPAMRSTVIHELVHAFLFSYGYQVDGEESMCNFFASQGDRIMELTNKIMKGVKGNAVRS